MKEEKALVKITHFKVKTTINFRIGKIQKNHLKL